MTVYANNPNSGDVDRQILGLTGLEKGHFHLVLNIWLVRDHIWAHEDVKNRITIPKVW